MSQAYAASRSFALVPSRSTWSEVASRHAVQMANGYTIHSSMGMTRLQFSSVLKTLFLWHE